MPMRVIAKKRCRAMFEPPEKGERATLNPNLSTRLNLLFSDQALGRRVGYCWSRRASGAVSPFFEVARQIGVGSTLSEQPYARTPSPRSGSQPSKIFSEAGETRAFVPRLIFNAKTLKLCSKIKFATQAQQTAPSRYAVECSQ